jgi:hypothetical protein
MMPDEWPVAGIRRFRGFGVALSLLVTAGCLESVPSGTYSCGAERICPRGQECDPDGICRIPGEHGGPALPDATPDIPMDTLITIGVTGACSSDADCSGGRCVDSLCQSGDAGSPCQLCDLPVDQTADVPDAGADAGPDGGLHHDAGTVVVYVDGAHGDDSNDGSSVSPFKTITRALQEAQGANSATIYVAGGDTTSVVHYAVNEAFPFDLPAYTQVIGDGSDTLSIEGAGECANGITCTFKVSGPGVLIQGIQVQNPAGTGILVGPGAEGVVLQNSTVATSATGVHIQAGSQHMLTSVLFDQDTTGLIVEGDAQVTMSQVAVHRSDTAGVAVRGTATLTSTGGLFDNNALGLDLREGSTVTLNGGDIGYNRSSGLRLSACSSPNTRVTLMGVQVQMNADDGLAINCGQAVLQDTSLFLNQQSGIHVTGTGTADLGGGFAGSEGRNTPNHYQFTLRNGNAGVCNQTATTISATNCTWPNTPPSYSAGCIGMVDISGPVVTM